MFLNCRFLCVHNDKVDYTSLVIGIGATLILLTAYLLWRYRARIHGAWSGAVHGALHGAARGFRHAAGAEIDNPGVELERVKKGRARNSDEYEQQIEGREHSRNGARDNNEGSSSICRVPEESKSMSRREGEPAEGTKDETNEPNLVLVRSCTCGWRCRDLAGNTCSLFATKRPEVLGEHCLVIIVCVEALRCTQI